MKSRSFLIAGGVILVVVLLAVVYIFGMNYDTGEETRGMIPQEEIPGEMEEGVKWYSVELTEIRTGESFKITDFSNKTVLLESFAVWCPKCKSQQQEIKKLHAELGDDVVSIGLNTDPNENEQLVRDYIDENGFDWRYAVSPTEMTQSLISEFGNSIINAPSVPIILICEDGKYRKLPSGVKSVSELKEEIAAGC